MGGLRAWCRHGRDAKMTLMYELNRFIRRIRKMAHLPILDSQGLTDLEHRGIQMMRKEKVNNLESLAFEKLLDCLARGHLDGRHLAYLPTMLHGLIAERITRTGVACPSLTLIYATRFLTALDLSFPNQNALTVPVLERLKHVRLQRLTIDGNAHLTDGALKHIGEIFSLTYLSLSHCQQLTNALFNHIKLLRNLKHLSLAGISKVNCTGLVQLHNGSNSVLERIDLSYTAVDDGVFNILSRHSNLLSLELSGAEAIHSLSGIENLHQLERLNLSHTHLSRSAVEDNLSLLKRLQHLEMNSTIIDGFRYTCLQYVFALPMLKYFNYSISAASTSLLYAMPSSIAATGSNLSTLSLTNSSWLTDRILSSLLTPLHGRLLELDLSLTNITGACVKTQLSLLPRLHTLGLQGLRLHDEHMEFLLQLHKLRKLNVNDTLLGDTFITDKMLGSCKQLELVSLCRTQITDRGLSCLKLEKLRSIMLDSCNVTVGTALALSTSNCPNLTYLSMKNLLPRLEHDDEENHAADALDFFE